MLPPLIHNDKDYYLEESCDNDALITDFLGLLRYTNHFRCCSKTSLIRFGDELKAPKIYHSHEEINIKEIDEKIGCSLFYDALNLKSGFYYFKKSSFKLLFRHTKIRLLKAVKLGFNENYEFIYNPELFKFKIKVFSVVPYCPHGYTVISSIAQNIDYYLISSMANLC
ncbi:hypothetical protein K502DRAFT_351723 [Neoconidiobolus thromboides FSU 785]|nr:hypothetical protein K502DRAFT_351723 [Neoconidiobolus thromboides FSU 785]